MQVRNVRGAGSRIGQGHIQRHDAVEVRVAKSSRYYAYMYNGVPPVPPLQLVLHVVA